MNVRRHSFLLLLCSFFFTAAASAAPTELFFSEYIEGSSTNKALEIYNGTSAAIDLAANAYKVEMYFNGGTSAGLTANLTGVIPAGGTFVLAPTNANATILAVANQTSGSSWFNGDDAVVLKHGAAIVDVIGQIGLDPGTEWGTGLVSTADNTIRRKSTVCAGDPIGSDAFDPAAEWDGFAQDTFGGLGNHTASCGVVANNAPSIDGPADPIATVGQDAAPFTVSLSGADDGGIYNWSATGGTGIQSVTVTGGQGTANVEYTVTLIGGFNGTAAFTASLSDNVNAAATQIVHITVNSPTVNDPPSISAPANPIATVTRDAAPFTVDLTGSDDHGVYDWSATSGTGIASVAVTSGGNTNSATFTVTLASGFTGLASFSASLSDTVNAAVTQTVNIQVNQPALPAGTIVISQIYGGGGNAGSTLHNDFIELFNRSDNPVSLDGWSVQHFSTSNAVWLATPLTGVIQPHSYYLVEEAAGTTVGGGTVPLPTPDAIGTIGLSSSAGTVALSRSTTLLSGDICAASSDITDWVGYGAGANCPGRVTIGGLSNTIAALRVQGGCKYTPSATDFSVGPPAPRHSASPVNDCGTLPPTPPHVMISQLYGGGGNNGATFFNDFVELYNPTDADVSLEGWSIQYTSAAGNSWGNNTQPLGGTIPTHGYFLIELASGGGDGATLPPPRIIGDINMAQTSGKLALVKSFSALTGNCPIGDANLVDFIGYGSADCFEGGLAAPLLSSSKSDIRATNTDTDQNSVDFTAVTPTTPRGSGELVELPPIVVSTEPATTNAPFDSTVTINFSEPVNVAEGWYSISCTSTGSHTDVQVHSAFGGKTYAITPNVTFAPGESCTVHLLKDLVTDVDTNDGPNTDTLPGDFEFTFKVASAVTLPYDADLNPADVHMKFGNPSAAVPDSRVPDNYLMVKPQYALSYNSDMGRPNWVSWHLTGSGPTEWFGSVTRVDTFRPDPMLPLAWYRVQAFDFASSGFDRGHMCPNADRDSTVPTMQSTFLMDNMIAQAPDNNQGPWAEMEQALRDIAGTTNEVYIVAGPSGVGGTGANGFAEKIANEKVTVPAWTWKAALILPKPANGDISDDIARVAASTRVIAVIMPNTQGIRSADPNDPTKNWMRFETTVDAIEQLTGYNLFSNIPSAIQNAIEASNDVQNIHPPGASTDQSASTPEDTATTFTLDVAAPNPAPLTYTIATQPAHGSLSIVSGSATYTPLADFNGADSFTYTVNDGTNTSTPGRVTITVSPVNDPPVATLSVPSTSLEGSAISAAVNASDVDGDTLTYAWTITKNGSPFANGAVVPFTFTPDDDGAYAVSVTVSDPAGATATDTKTVSVSNVAPVITSVTGPTSSLSLGGVATLTFTYTDAGSADTHTAVVTWDDGSASGAVCGSGACTAPHTYATAGIYTASIALTDDDGGAASSAFSPIIITDANAGFVTGGGWVMSPAGKANFSISAKYVKNQTAPVGSASVQVAGTTFESTSIDWLVVRGGAAQFAGGGTINGTGDYGYQVFAADGSVDKFRVRIFDKSTNATIFENAADAQALGGGNIVIH